VVKISVQKGNATGGFELEAVIKINELLSTDNALKAI